MLFVFTTVIAKYQANLGDFFVMLIAFIIVFIIAKFVGGRWGELDDEGSIFQATTVIGAMLGGLVGLIIGLVFFRDLYQQPNVVNCIMDGLVGGSLGFMLGSPRVQKAEPNLTVEPKFESLHMLQKNGDKTAQGNDELDESGQRKSKKKRRRKKRSKTD